MLSWFAVAVVRVHVSAPYVRTGLINVLYNLILVHFDKNALLKNLIFAKKAMFAAMILLFTSLTIFFFSFSVLLAQKNG